MQENVDLLLDSYDYELPTHLIADRPVQGRHHSKLLVYNHKNGSIIHTTFKDIDQFIPENSTLVLNQSKVFPCRLFGEKPSGGKAELFVLTLISENDHYEVMIRARGKKEVGDLFHFGELKAKVETIEKDGTFKVSFNKSKEALLNFLERNANIPIPPYIRDGIADEKDKEDYQTVYAKEVGSVAAPTAGLHFTDEVFQKLERVGVKRAFVTLHVGAGTFKPVTSDKITDHNMHSEFYDIDDANAELISQNKKNLIAVGTTSLRTLESCSQSGEFQKPSGDKPWSTDIFIYPGKPVHSIQGMITNFHLPKSSLIMLVSAIIGREKTLELYKIAVENNYRFYSYGDAMLILR
jgi:S-adenosylmethionine:tRNA ribosyltransferase-isomerase